MLVDGLCAMTPDELGYVEELYADLVGHTDYLTQWGVGTGAAAAENLRFALEVSYIAHRGQKRKSGELFIIHPVNVASILADSKMDLPSLTAGLLHDTVEDTSLTFEAISALFGDEVRRIVEGETKVSKLWSQLDERPAEGGVNLDDAKIDATVHGMATAASRKDEQAENLRSMFVAMADDWRIVVVKLADRLHNMRTLHFMPPRKQVAIARETLEIFTPLAHRLGMWGYKTELADLSFKYLFPHDYQKLRTYIECTSDYYKGAVDTAARKMEHLVTTNTYLKQRVRRVAMEGRTKSIYSTWRKMQRRDCRVEEVHDLLALRIIIETEPSAHPTSTDSMPTGTMPTPSASAADASSATLVEGQSDADAESGSDADEAALCFHVLGLVNSCSTPLPSHFKDYISSPKPNGYRSLHTTVLIGDAYSEAGGEAGVYPLEVQIRTASMHNVAENGNAAHWAYQDSASLPWQQAIRNWETDTQCAHEFMQLVRKELLCTRVFVFTEGGRVLNLALGATLADAAEVLKVSRSDMQLPYICCHNLCESATLDTVLSNGDILHFAPAEGELPAGCKLVEHGSPAQQQQQQQPEPFGTLSASTEEAPAPEVLRPPAPTKGSVKPSMPMPRRVDLADGCLLTDTQWSVCEHCFPLPGDALVCTRQARRGKPSGFVHRASSIASGISMCKHLRRQIANGCQLVEEGEEMCELAQVALDEANDDGSGSRVLTTSLVVFAWDEPGALLAITQLMTTSTLNINDVRSRERRAAGKPGMGAFQFRVQLSSLEQLDVLTAALESLPLVVCVRRDSMDMMLEESADAFWPADALAR